MWVTNPASEKIQMKTVVPSQSPDKFPIKLTEFKVSMPDHEPFEDECEMIRHLHGEITNEGEKEFQQVSEFSEAEISSQETNTNADLKYIMTLELENGKSDRIKIYSESNPSELAYNFCKKNNLDFNSLKYLTNQIEIFVNNIDSCPIDEKKDVNESENENENENVRNNLLACNSIEGSILAQSHETELNLNKKKLELSSIKNPTQKEVTTDSPEKEFILIPLAKSPTTTNGILKEKLKKKKKLFQLFPYEVPLNSQNMYSQHNKPLDSKKLNNCSSTGFLTSRDREKNFILNLTPEIGIGSHPIPSQTRNLKRRDIFDRLYHEAERKRCFPNGNCNKSRERAHSSRIIKEQEQRSASLQLSSGSKIRKNDITITTSIYQMTRRIMNHTSPNNSHIMRQLNKPSVYSPLRLSSQNKNNIIMNEMRSIHILEETFFRKIFSDVSDLCNSMPPEVFSIIFPIIAELNEERKKNILTEERFQISMSTLWEVKQYEFFNIF